MTAIDATFTSIKHIQGRKVYQLVLEVAQENIDHALAVLGGMPKSDDPVWVAVARLNRTGRDAGPPPVETPDAGGEGRDTPRRPFRELPPTTQAVLACKDKRFQRWIGASDEDLAVLHVRDRCGVRSRSLLNVSAEAAARWQSLYAQYRRDTGLETEER